MLEMEQATERAACAAAEARTAAAAAAAKAVECGGMPPHVGSRIMLQLQSMVLELRASLAPLPPPA